jgi:uncharacterized protein (DUF1800 family)
MRGRRSLDRIFCALLTASLAALPGFASPSPALDAVEKPPLTPREKAIHVLNRLAFGPRPGDVEQVMRIGVAAWIEHQLHPERISDARLSERLARLSTLSLSSRELFDRFEKPVREARHKLQQRDGAPENGEAGARNLSPADRDALRAMIPPENRPRRILEELSASRVLRAVYSERQLNEVLVDFWMNHFNVFFNKGLDRILVTAFERDTIRPHIWGRFEDLLMATAKSPAMLFYLDNAVSVADEANRPAPSPRAFWTRYGFLKSVERESKAQKKGASGLNENYARELMELHTLGVDGGYTQRDVTELARALTGWSIDRQGQEPGGFLFRARVHDEGPKTILGYRLPPGGGIEEGERMIRALARHPATAHHIAYQLCQRLVADDPPGQLVDRVARRFLATGGDLRETVRAVVESPEFFDPENYRAKVKSPFEYAVSVIRATAAETDGGDPVVRAVAQMGEPLYLCQPPTGYSDAASAWVNAGALVARLNFALAIAGGRIPGTRVDLAELQTFRGPSESQERVSDLAERLTGSDLTATTRATIAQRLQTSGATGADTSADTELPMIAGLILGSPEFQRQ